jgi:serine/threonine protein kinase
LSGEDIYNLVAKLGDFGLARDNKLTASTFTHIGSQFYWAPERILY